MVIILDNVINNIDSVKVEIQDILKDQNISEDWCTFEKNHKFQDFCCKFIDIAANFYDMSSCVGYEFWTQNNSRPSDWHYDKDEDFLEEKLKPFMRHTGPTNSPFNAWLQLKGLETLALRVEKMSANALEVAKFLSKQREIKSVLYPGLESHPQFELAQQQMKGGSTLISFQVSGGRKEAFKFQSNTNEIFNIILRL